MDNKQMDKILKSLLEADEISAYGIIGENGYGEKTIIIGGWNDNEALEKYLSQFENSNSISLQFDDEWTTCPECGKYFRTVSDSYGWISEMIYMNGDSCCIHCETEENHEELCKNNSDTFWRLSEEKLISLGYEMLDVDFETGFHPGMNDTPEKILEELQKDFPDHDFIFGNFSKSQFYVTYGIYKKKRDIEEE